MEKKVKKAALFCLKVYKFTEILKKKAPVSVVYVATGEFKSRVNQRLSDKGCILYNL